MAVASLIFAFHINLYQAPVSPWQCPFLPTHTHTDTDPSIPLVISRRLPRVQCNAICLSHSPVPSRQLGLQRFLLPFLHLLPFSLHRDQKLNMTSTPQRQRRMSDSCSPHHEAFLPISVTLCGWRGGLCALCCKWLISFWQEIVRFSFT